MLKNIFKNLIFYLIICFTSYLFYVYPFVIGNKIFLNNDISIISLIFYTIFISSIVTFYLKSKNTFYPIKFFVYEGIGIGFVSFWIINIFLLIDYFFYFNS